MQLRFTLQASTPESPRWRKVAAPSWGEWITVPPSFAKYTYAKTVQDLLPPANYRAVVNFRWKDRKGRTLRSERAISPVCKQPDTRPDLVVRNVRFENGQYVATIFNRGRDRRPATSPSTSSSTGAVRHGRGRRPGGADGGHRGAARRPLRAGTPLEAVADPRSEVDEADEENDSLSASC